MFGLHAKVRTTDRVHYAGGFIPPGTDGEILFAISDNSFRCEFTLGEEPQTVTTTVMEDTIIEV